MRFNPLIASVCHLVFIAAQKCYYPDRSEATSDIPCNLASADRGSACCTPEHTCLSNGLCFSQSGRLTRRTCTDQTWQSSGCAQYCQNSLTGIGQAIVLVKYATTGTPSFCCGPGYNGTSQTCAENPATPFTIHLGMTINNRTSGSTSPNITSDSQNTLPPITTTITASASANSSSTNRDTAIGAGVGVALGVALLTALGLLWRERRDKQRLRREVEALSAARDPSAPATGNKWHNGDDPNMHRESVHQLDDAVIGELEGDRVNEMAERAYR